MATFETHIDIEASVTRVWDVLTDFGRYAEWNPLFVSIEGSLANGSRTTVLVKPPFGRQVAMRGRILRLEPERELAWRFRTLLPGLYHCELGFRLDCEDDHVRLHHREAYGGGLMFLVGGGRGKKMREGCFAMNLAIKRRAEDQDWNLWPRARG